LTEAIWAALGVDGPPSAIYQVGSGVETSVNTLFALLGDLAEARLGRRPRVQHQPPRAGEVLRNYADISRARAELGFAPLTPLLKGLETTFDWFLGQRKAATIR
jgi:nucleoside-diphosphate-sugar epimerase